MAKETNVIFRLESIQKDRITNAARAAGQSLTYFVLETVMEKVATIETSGPSGPFEYSRGHCPAFFRAWCITASTGGSQGYIDVGYNLLQTLATECPSDIEENDWFQSLKGLEELLGFQGADKEIMGWFESYLPRFLELVPSRRRGSFIEGLRIRCKEEGLEI